jgi:phospholipid/cholesterol/gamma-HCH transport system substrate-binding protein
MRPRLLSSAAAALVVLVVAYTVWPVHSTQRRLTAHFSEVVGVFVGSDVRVMGVRVGEVTAVVPEGQTVRVDMRYDTSWPVPADVQALVVPPSVVSDRYVQLTPAYSTGPMLEDGADLPVSRTVIPLEVDDLYKTLNDVAQTLGPNGANADGALGRLVATLRQNLDGNGDNLHDTLSGLSTALDTLADGREDLFGSLNNLADLSTALAASDDQVRDFNLRLADVSNQLAAERDDLASALNTLATALGDIRDFIRENRDTLVSDVSALTDITNALVRQQAALMEVLDVAPTALSNLALAYNPSSGTLDTRDDALGPYDPAAYACSLMVGVVPISQIPQTCFQLAQLLQQRGLALTDQLKQLLAQLPSVLPDASSNVSGGADSSSDSTLGGLLRSGS